MSSPPPDDDDARRTGPTATLFVAPLRFNRQLVVFCVNPPAVGTHFQYGMPAGMDGLVKDLTDIYPDILTHVVQTFPLPYTPPHSATAVETSDEPTASAAAVVEGDLLESGRVYGAVTARADDNSLWIPAHTIAPTASRGYLFVLNGILGMEQAHTVYEVGGAVLRWDLVAHAQLDGMICDPVSMSMIRASTGLGVSGVRDLWVPTVDTEPSTLRRSRALDGTVVEDCTRFNLMRAKPVAEHLLVGVAGALLATEEHPECPAVFGGGKSTELSLHQMDTASGERMILVDRDTSAGASTHYYEVNIKTDRYTMNVGVPGVTFQWVATVNRGTGVTTGVVPDETLFYNLPRSA